MRATLLLVMCAAVLPGAALAQDDPACARFEEPLAYNACLASHGPKANLGSTPEGADRHVEPEDPVPTSAAPAGAPRRAPGPAAVARRHGRVHMEISHSIGRNERGAQARGRSGRRATLPRAGGRSDAGAPHGPISIRKAPRSNTVSGGTAVPETVNTP